MKWIFLTATLLTAGLFSGCAYPEKAKVEQKDARPTLGIAGAPAGAKLFVDGLDMGPAARFNGKAGVLLVESGKHQIEVRSPSGAVLYTEEVFLSGETTKILTFKP
ncbi:hypothetical protein [Pontiella agarivorans]|uniref:PEGA domain-containing protein n=1 Tax=Pontiella agarivorans TaxID=3038953 RepID=A0ABU5MWZ3_9BACT|nr:hypothetical protein [Pontiella agarivorans]MDZ8118481.1 hypothetical protein [Pontiella agarivorans]